ncbi:hypothetical protein MMC30_006386 [Trapelia coarctata]|nr:hypothetical protein [Trapelia coarctata]
MGKHRKRSYAEYEKEEEDNADSSNIGVGATLAHLRDPLQHSGVETHGSPLDDDDNARRFPNEWDVVDRRSKKRRKTHRKHASRLSPEQVPAKKKDNRPALTYAQLHKMQSSLTISDLQGLVIYCLADGTSPQWVSVRHHNQIRKVVVLLVPGLERDMFNGHIELSDSAPSLDIGVQSTSLSPANNHTSTELSNSKIQNPSHANHGRSPDDYLPIPLESDRLPVPLKPLAHIFDHLWPVKAPGDDKYNKVHSPLHAMLAAPIPKSREQRLEQEIMKGPKSGREVSGWKNERTPVSRFLLSGEDLRENEFTLHSANLPTKDEQDLNFKRRQMAQQLEENGWVDTIIADLSEADVPDAEVQSGSVTMGRTVLALDCEMCLVEGGESALTRISIVNWDGEVVMDELVMPDRPITNYLTQYSGMTAERLATVTTTLSDIQTQLLRLLTPRSILVGHSLNSDLAALKVAHPFIIDTSVLYPHPRGHPLKSSLKYLSQKYLGREIQKHHGASGHDSIEDATACLDLLKQKCEKGPKWGTSEATNEPIYKRLSRTSRPGTAATSRTGAIVDLGASVRSFNGVADVCIRCDNDDEVVSGVKRAVGGDEDGAVVPGGGVDFTWARLHELEVSRGWTNDSSPALMPSSDFGIVNLPPPEPSTLALSKAVSQTVHNILSIHAALPSCTLFIVYSGTGDRRDMARLQKMHWQFKREYATKKWDELSVRWTDEEEQALRRACSKARKGMALICVTFCLRRAAFRALSSPYGSISARPRSITTLTSLTIRKTTPACVSPFQRRSASEAATQAETETQAEPEADGATEAQHGDNSIASSTKDSSDPASDESSATERAIESAQDEQPVTTLAPETETAYQGENGAIESAVSSAADSITTGAFGVRERVADAASAIGASAGVASAIAGRDKPRAHHESQSAHTLYIGNLFFDVTEDALKREMERFGTVDTVKIIYDGRGLSKGFGYVEYADATSAGKAIEVLNHQVFEGRRLTVQYSIRKERVPRASGARNPPTKTLFIGNMSFEMTDKDLNDLFRDIKNVIDVRVAIDRRTGQPRGFAHADFIDTASASKAYELLESKEVYGRKLRVDYSLSSAQTRSDPPAI